MRTREECNAEVDKLEAMKPNVRMMTAFGDNNHDAIDAQIDVLRGYMDDDIFNDEYGDNEDVTDHVRDSAQYAFDWMNEMNDDTESSPSEDWIGLVQ